VCCQCGSAEISTLFSRRCGWVLAAGGCRCGRRRRGWRGLRPAWRRSRGTRLPRRAVSVGAAGRCRSGRRRRGRRGLRPAWRRSRGTRLPRRAVRVGAAGGRFSSCRRWMPPVSAGHDLRRSRGLRRRRRLGQPRDSAGRPAQELRGGWRSTSCRWLLFASASASAGAARDGPRGAPVLSAPRAAARPRARRRPTTPRAVAARGQPAQPRTSLEATVESGLRR
jgi:hypothetical protein